MLELTELVELEVVVALELGVASSHGVGGFLQVVTVVAVAGFDKLGMLRLEVALLVLCPNKASVFGDRCLIVDSMHISNLSDDTG